MKPLITVRGMSNKVFRDSNSLVGAHKEPNSENRVCVTLKFKLVSSQNITEAPAAKSQMRVKHPELRVPRAKRSSDH